MKEDGAAVPSACGPPVGKRREICSSSTMNTTTAPPASPYENEQSLLTIRLMEDGSFRYLSNEADN